MNINTKVVFEWSDKRHEYIEIYSEGYEYSGDLELAQRGSGRGSGRRGPQAATPGPEKTLDEYLEGGMTIAEIANFYDVSTSNASKFFTPIPESIVAATQPGYWDSYEQLREEMTIEPAQRQFEMERGTLSSKLGRTGLARPAQGDQMQTMLRSDFLTKMKGIQFDIASDIEQKKVNATERLNALVKQNANRALQLDEMA